MSDVLREISETLRDETGMGGGVCIWRKDRSEVYFHPGTVADFLLDHSHQSGEWCIDGGWGGPPGPIVVRWHVDGYWENGGFCGGRFND